MNWKNYKERIKKHIEKISRRRLILECTLACIPILCVSLAVFAGCAMAYSHASDWWHKKPATIAQTMPPASATQSTPTQSTPTVPSASQVNTETSQSQKPSPTQRATNKTPGTGTPQPTTSATEKKPKPKHEPESDIDIETVAGSEGAPGAIEQPHDCGATDCSDAQGTTTSESANAAREKSTASADTTARSFQKEFEPDGDVQFRSSCQQRGTEIQCIMGVRNVGDARHNFSPEDVHVSDQYGNSYAQPCDITIHFNPGGCHQWLEPGLGSGGWINFPLTIHKTRPVENNATITPLGMLGNKLNCIGKTSD